MENRETEQRQNALKELSQELLIGEADFNGLETSIQVALYHRILNLQERIKQLTKRVHRIK